MLRRYLLEIGMEEFPAGYVKNAKRQAVDTMAKMLSEQEIPYEKIEMETTPRFTGFQPVSFERVFW